MSPEEIREVRRRLNINRIEFGKLVGVSWRTVEKYEQGTCKPGGAATINIKRLRDGNEGIYI